MSDKPIYLAIDLGAGSGRVMAGERSGESFIALTQVHRFKSPPREEAGHLRWDFADMMQHIETGLALAAAQYGERIRSISVDTWGVDFGLLDASNELMGNPICYRDPRHEEGMAVVYAAVPEERLFASTGIYPLALNTIFQLGAELGKDDSRLGLAQQLLFIPDLICFRLSGVARNERTIASTGALLDAKSRNWAGDILKKIGLDPDLFCPLVDPGTVLGPILPEVASRTGLPQSVDVIAGAAHDTASAVAAVPFASADEAFLSSGTWSLLGVECSEPLLERSVVSAGFSNEGGVNGTTRLLANVIGLWIFEECRKVWQAEGKEVDYGRLLERAHAAKPFAGYIDAISSEWIAPGDMVNRLRKAIVATGGEDTEDEGSLTRTIFEGLAIAYARKLEALETLLGKPLSAIRIVGGGSQNTLLNQMTADACNRPVIAGPVEATSLGNILIQMVAEGEVASIAEGRKGIAGDPSLRTFTPNPKTVADWKKAITR
jgi:rhamnulokinase